MVEVVTSGLALSRPTTFWMYAAWRARVRPLLAGTGLQTFLAVVSGPTCYVPDFLTPVPATARPSLADELRVVAGTPLDRVAAEVDAAWAGHTAPPQVLRFGTDPAGALAELVRQIRRYFELAVAPVWPRLRAAVEGEIAHRALAAAERGPRALLADLHPKLDWDGSTLRLGYAKSRHWGLDGHPLALMPAGFAGPMVHTMTEAPTGRALWYPPRGYGRLWDQPKRIEPSAALAALLGPTRAAVLTLLAVPCSTGEVATALGLAPATASHHLTTLRDAGLVVGERVGRRLRYLRTGLGEQLGGGSEAPTERS
jgi:DNA-binding transcriptional ArsR family regulator